MKAIKTLYEGTLFRSKLEARWAAFFDLLDIIWDYEPEGYTDGKICYLPDFYLPMVSHRAHSTKGTGVFFEVKAIDPTSDESHKAMVLSNNGSPVILASGSPPNECLHEYTKGGFYDQWLSFASCSNCSHIDIGHYDGDTPLCLRCGRGHYLPSTKMIEEARHKFSMLCRWEPK